MNIKIQIIVLTVSFFYGFIYYYLTKLNTYIIKNQKKIYRSLITTLFMYNIILLYIIIIYKINHGKFHPYFFITILIGYITCEKITKKMLKNVKFHGFLAKLKNKCYTKKNRRDYLWGKKLPKKKKDA